MISTIHYKAADAEKVLSTIEKEIEEIGKAGEKKPKNNEKEEHNNFVRPLFHLLLVNPISHYLN